MKQFLILFGLSMAISANLTAQTDVSGRWKETQRFDINYLPTAYKDTLWIYDITPTSLNIKAGSFQYKGKIEKGIIDIGYQTYVYTILSKDEIILKDEEATHSFTREKKDTSIKYNPDFLLMPEKPVDSVNTTLLNGKWKVYKRINKKGNTDKPDYKNMVQAINYDISNAKNKSFVSMMNDAAGGPLVIVKIENADLIYVNASGTQYKLKVWKLNSDELILEDGNGIIYFMKQFN